MDCLPGVWRGFRFALSKRIIDPSLESIRANRVGWIPLFPWVPTRNLPRKKKVVVCHEVSGGPHTWVMCKGVLVEPGQWRVGSTLQQILFSFHVHYSQLHSLVMGLKGWNMVTSTKRNVGWLRWQEWVCHYAVEGVPLSVLRPKPQKRQLHPQRKRKHFRLRNWRRGVLWKSVCNKCHCVFAQCV